MEEFFLDPILFPHKRVDPKSLIEAHIPCQRCDLTYSDRSGNYIILWKYIKCVLTPLTKVVGPAN